MGSHLVRCTNDVDNYGAVFAGLSTVAGIVALGLQVRYGLEKRRYLAFLTRLNREAVALIRTGGYKGFYSIPVNVRESELEFALRARVDGLLECHTDTGDTKESGTIWEFRAPVDPDKFVHLRSL